MAASRHTAQALKLNPSQFSMRRAASNVLQSNQTHSQYPTETTRSNNSESDPFESSLGETSDEDEDSTINGDEEPVPLTTQAQTVQPNRPPRWQLDQGINSAQVSGAPDTDRHSASDALVQPVQTSTVFPSRSASGPNAALHISRMSTNVHNSTARDYPVKLVSGFEGFVRGTTTVQPPATTSMPPPAKPATSTHTRFNAPLPDHVQQQHSASFRKQPFQTHTPPGGNALRDDYSKMDDDSAMASFDHGMESPPLTESANNQHVDADERPAKRPFRLEDHMPDYDLEARKRLGFAVINKDSFEHDPNPQPSIIPSDLADNVPSLLEHFRKANDDTKKKLFKQMGLSQWEDAGDWFLTGFSDFVKKMQENRKRRRELSDDFEKKVVERMAHIERYGAALGAQKEFLRGKADEALKGTPQRKKC